MPGYSLATQENRESNDCFITTASLSINNDFTAKNAKSGIDIFYNKKKKIEELTKQFGTSSKLLSEYTTINYNRDSEDEGDSKDFSISASATYSLDRIGETEMYKLAELLNSNGINFSIEVYKNKNNEIPCRKTLIDSDWEPREQ